MRLNAAKLLPQVTVAADSVRPVRLRLGGSLMLAMESDEAIALARKLVVAVDELARRDE